MKKKILITISSILFATITFYNVEVSKQNEDISLDHVALMAHASIEIPTTTAKCPEGKIECLRVVVGGNVQIFYKK